MSRPLELVRGLHNLRPEHRGCVATIGNYDGVHRGHQHVLARTRELAEGNDLVVVTFDPHPMAVVRPDREPRKLTTLERRVELLREHGADEVHVLAFSEEMSGWSPAEFVERVLVEQLMSSAVVVGEKFRFGHKAAGDVAYLTGEGERHGFTAVGLALVGDGEVLSSTRARTTATPWYAAQLAFAWTVASASDSTARTRPVGPTASASAAVKTPTPL